MVRTFIIAFILLLSIKTSYAQEQYTLSINFTGFKSDKGKLYVAIYNNEKDFLKKAIKGTIIEVKNNKAKVVLNDMPMGVYAVSAFHDANDNKKMDTNFIGIPKEPIGISNNAKGFMGPPKYKKAKFSLEKNKTINIEIK